MTNTTAMVQTPIYTSPRPRIPAPGLSAASPARFAALYYDCKLMGMLRIEPGGMVDLAVSELGARLIAVGWVIPERNESP